MLSDVSLRCIECRVASQSLHVFFCNARCLVSLALQAAAVAAQDEVDWGGEEEQAADAAPGEEQAAAGAGPPAAVAMAGDEGACSAPAQGRPPPQGWDPAEPRIT